MDAGRHGDPAHRGAAYAPRGGALARAGRQRLPRSDAGGAGENLRLRERDQNRQRRAAIFRRARLFARAAVGAHGARRAHVHHRRRHRAGAAHAGCRKDAGLETAADARRLCAETAHTRRRGVAMHPIFASADELSVPILFVTAAAFDKATESIDDRARMFLHAAGYEPKPGRYLAMPAADGKLASVLFGLENADEPVKDLFRPGQLSTLLPPGTYRFANAPHDARLAARWRNGKCPAAAGWTVARAGTGLSPARRRFPGRTARRTICRPPPASRDSARAWAHIRRRARTCARGRRCSRLLCRKRRR